MSGLRLPTRSGLTFDSRIRRHEVTRTVTSFLSGRRQCNLVAGMLWQCRRLGKHEYHVITILLRPDTGENVMATDIPGPATSTTYCLIGCGAWK